MLIDIFMPCGKPKAIFKMMMKNIIHSSLFVDINIARALDFYVCIKEWKLTLVPPKYINICDIYDMQKINVHSSNFTDFSSIYYSLSKI